MNNILSIGLFGFGVVGQGLYDVLKHIHTAKPEINKIVVKNRDKARGTNADIISYNPNDIINNSDINLVVELIDDSNEAYHIVKHSLKQGKHVVSGNKKMIAEHLPELIDLQQEHNVSLLYDASACGSIPVIRNLEEYYDNDLLTRVTGILNGSSNYILSKLFSRGYSYHTALKEAQDKGFAESNPTFDVDGFDSLYKLIIITVHSFGTYVAPDKIFRFGISNINNYDVEFAKEKGCKIKLIAQVEKLADNRISLCVVPSLVKPHKYIYNVENEYNGVVIEGKFYDKQFMFGKGAGGHPTGSAVLSDITALSHNYRYEYKKRNYHTPPEFTTDNEVTIYLRYTSISHLNLFNFSEITERHNSTNYSYVIGRITINNLIDIQNRIADKDLFIALIDRNNDKN